MSIEKWVQETVIVEEDWNTDPSSVEEAEWRHIRHIFNRHIPKEEIKYVRLALRCFTDLTIMPQADLFVSARQMFILCVYNIAHLL